MKRFVFLILCACAGLSFGVTMPDGFVYRASCYAASNNKPITGSIDVTLRLYTEEKSDVPVWTGVFREVPIVTNGLFQIWVSQAYHDAEQTQEKTLEETLWSGSANWIGVTFGSGKESKPRRMLMTTPLAHTAVVSEALDPIVQVDDLMDCTSIVAGEAQIDTLACDTFVFGAMSDLKFNVADITVRSSTLYRDTNNRILSTAPATWSPAELLETGRAITNTTGRTAFLSLRSVDGVAAPLLSFPVPAGAAYVWQAPPATCQWRFTCMGVE